MQNRLLQNLTTAAAPISIRRCNSCKTLHEWTVRKDSDIQKGSYVQSGKENVGTPSQEESASKMAKVFGASSTNNQSNVSPRGMHRPEKRRTHNAITCTTDSKLAKKSVSSLSLHGFPSAPDYRVRRSSFSVLFGCLHTEKSPQVTRSSALRAKFSTLS